MRKNLTGVFIMSVILLILSTVTTLSAETEGIYNIIIQEDQGIPYISAQMLDVGHMKLVYPNALAGYNYTIAVQTERAELSNTNIVYLDQKKAQGSSVSYDIYLSNLRKGQYYIFISSDADKKITKKTEVASFSYGYADSDMKKPSTIIVKTRPVKTVYKIGENLDLEGIVITMIYSDGSTDEVAYDGTNMSFSGFDSSKAMGRQRVTVVYQSMEAVFTVDIIESNTEVPSDTEVPPDTEIKPVVGTSSEKQISLAKADISGVKASYTYAKKAFCPVPIVKIDTQVLKRGIDYDLSYENNTDAGTASIIITGKGNYIDTAVKKFTIKPAASKITVSKTKFKAKTLKKKSQKTWIKVAGSNGKITFKYSKKHIFVSKKGVVTLKKRTPKGTYKIKVTVAGKKNYKKTVTTIKIIVK